MQRIALVELFLGLTLAGALAGQPPAELRPSPPVVCTGNEDVTIRGRLIETDGDGVVSRGNCDITIVDSKIVAGGAGVVVLSNGDIEIANSYVEGRRVGLLIDGNGDIELEDTEVRGGTEVHGLGEIVDEGGNRIEGGGRTASTRASGTDVRAGNVRITEDGVRVGDEDVTITERGVTVSGRGVTVTDQGGRVRVDSDSSQVVVDGDYVRLEGGAGETSRWREGGSSTYSERDTDRLLVELDAKDSGGRIELSMAGDVLFDFDSSAVRPAAETQLRKVAHLLRVRSAGEIYVVGHTDSIGSDAYNQKLSEARAVAVMRWLSENEQIPLALMRGQGAGSKQPIAHNTRPDGSDDPEGRARNRRVEVRFAAAQR